MANMNHKIKFDDWFECILIVPPEILIVHLPQDENSGPTASDTGDDTWLYLIFLFSDDKNIYGANLDREDIFQQAIEYWLQEKDKLILELKKFGKDYLRGPNSINIVKNILYYDRAIKLTIEKYLEYQNQLRNKSGIKKRMTVSDLPKPVMDWIPQFDAEILERFCKELVPEVSDAYVLKCFNPGSEVDDEARDEEKIKVTKKESLALCEKLMNSDYEMTIEEEKIVKTKSFSKWRNVFMNNPKNDMYKNFPSILSELEKQRFISYEKFHSICHAPSQYYDSVLLESFKQHCRRKDLEYYERVGGKNLMIKVGKQGTEYGLKLVPKQ